jgi:hypothetical protein
MQRNFQAKEGATSRSQPDRGSYGDDDDCDSNADNEYGILEPVLTFGESATAPIPGELPRLVDNPSALDISDAISVILPLNNKQKRTGSRE